MRGRKPKPAALKLIRGNPGRRRVNTREPSPPAEPPSCPKHLTAEGRREWQRITAHLRDMGLLAACDRAALASYCVLWARWVKAEQTIRSQGELLKARKTGTAYPNPWLSVAQRSMILMLKFSTEFGLTPSSRTRVRSAEVAGNRDEFTQFLEGS
jgi:P27 family predicted phage terminase small subunit